MKTTLYKFSIYLLIWVIAISCSSIPNQATLRIPAAIESTCKEIASAIISPKKIEATEAATEKLNIPFSLPDVSLNKVIKSRKSLRERYAKFTESIRDFEVHPDLPINGKTKLLLDPREGYLAKIMLIRNAKETIDLSYYIFKSDDSGNAILHELRMAIKRGVKVRILVDSSGSISKAPFYNDIKALISLSGKPILDENGVPTGELAKAEAVLFNPLFNVRAHVANWMKAAYNLFVSTEEKLPLATFTINRRSHDKILLIDSHSETDSMAIIGGRNIADRYYEIGEGEENPILDAEILIKGFTHRNEDGTTQNALESHYNKIYYYMANKNFEDFLFKTNRNSIRKEFKVMRNSARHLFDENSSLGDQLKVMEEESFLDEGFEDGLISILNEIQNLSRTKIFLKPNGPQNKVNGNSLIKKMHDQISKAEKTVDIITPYFWVPEEEVEYIISWAMKNPDRKVRIFSNSLTTTDNIVAQSVVDATFEKKIIEKIKGTRVENQFEIYSFGKMDDEMLEGNKRYGFLHAKLVITDNKDVTVSTSNLDPISRHLNSEIGVTVENLPNDSKNMAKLKKYVDDLQTNSTQWGSDEWHQIRNHPKNKTMKLLQVFVTKIIYALNLVPLI